MKKLALAAVAAASAALAVMRRRRQQDTIKARLTGYYRRMKDRL